MDITKKLDEIEGKILDKKIASTLKKWKPKDKPKLSAKKTPARAPAPKPSPVRRHDKPSLSYGWYGRQVRAFFSPGGNAEESLLPPDKRQWPKGAIGCAVSVPSR